MADQNAKDMISACTDNIVLVGRESAQLFNRDLTTSKLRTEFESLV